MSLRARATVSGEAISKLTRKLLRQSQAFLAMTLFQLW